jgi:hypothetical protein
LAQEKCLAVIIPHAVCTLLMVASVATQPLYKSENRKVPGEVLARRVGEWVRDCTLSSSRNIDQE